MKALVFLAAAFLTAATIPPPDSGLTVHEWGTFTSVAAADGSAAEWFTLGCGDDLPKFVNERDFRHSKFTLGGTVRMETPVMYFYSPREITADVKVSFPNGVMTEWYPRADFQLYLKNRFSGNMYPSPSNSGMNPQMTNQTGALEWKSVTVQPGGSSAFPVESAPSRYYAARATDAAPLTVGGQHEKFLFYRGVANIPVPLTALANDDGSVEVAGRAPLLVLFENRGGALGYRNAGTIDGAMKLARPQLNSSIVSLKADLESALIAQGLFPKEAAAMIDTWRDSWFEEGSRLIYILPQSAVDAMLPLEITPSPAKTARVFVGRIELITPETKRIVKDAMGRGDLHTIAAYQRFQDPILKSIGEAPRAACAPASQR